MATPMDKGQLETEHSLGKGEVLSSILSGSTTNAHETLISSLAQERLSAIRSRTSREHDATIRGKSVDSVHAAFLRWYERRQSTLSIEANAAARVVELHLRMMKINEVMTPLQLLDVAADVECLRASLIRNDE